jgi:hypothetical protein
MLEIKRAVSDVGSAHAVRHFPRDLFSGDTPQ